MAIAGFAAFAPIEQIDWLCSTATRARILRPAFRLRTRWEQSGLENPVISTARKVKSQLCNNLRVWRVTAACRKETINGLVWHFPAGPIPADLHSLIEALDFPLDGSMEQQLVVSRFFVKRKRHVQLSDIAKHLVRASPAMTSFAAGLELRRNGVSTPQPLAVGRKRSAGILLESCLIVEHVPHARQLAQLADGTRHVAAALAEMIVRVESLGYIHGDLSLENVLIDDAGRLHLVDLDTTIYAGTISPQQSRYQLARFWFRAARYAAVTPTLRARFLVDYCRFRGDRDWKRWWREIAALSAAEASRRARKSTTTAAGPNPGSSRR